jgi:two-component system, chemotaxis family, CheB/CheR fusion protein
MRSGARKAPPAAQSEDPPSDAPEFLVAIGSSAGGFEATKEFFVTIPADTGMAFVIVPHLDPTHESHLADLMRRETQMPIAEAEDGMAVEANHVYVIAPNTTMIILDGRLHLKERIKAEDRGVLVIDRFFRSVAEAYGDRAVGIVLSGALGDGTDGVRAIKAAGGFTLVQDPKTATFPEMPKNAIRTGMVDVVGPPAQLAEILAGMRGDLYRPGDASEKEAEQDSSRAYEKIMEAVHKTTGTDFRLYKRPTLLRRIQRRMMATKHPGLEDYARFVSGSAEEAKRLHQEFLLLVTHFFRDGDITRAIEEEVLPAILDRRAYNEPLRAWVAGCATGEEAYSLAILLTEYAERHDLSVQLTVFATDLSTTAIRIAREGAYPESISEYVSEERLERFFEPHGGGYRIRKHIRGMCVFAEHNVVQDPAFSNMDLVSCRNLLVYMEPPLQRRAIEAFHYALRPDGFLILGSAESVGRNRDLFESVSETRCVLRRRNGRPKARRGAAAPAEPVDHVKAIGVPPGEVKTATIDREADRVLLERHAPPGVVVDQAMRTVHFHGDTARLLKHRKGPANLNLLQMVPPGLAREIQDAVDEADDRGEAVRRGSVTFEDNGQSLALSLDVVPLPGHGAAERYYLITFEEDGARSLSRRSQPSPQARSGGFLEAFTGRSKRVLEEQLKQAYKEAREAREHLRHITAAHEWALEELRSANEEAVSTNEELLSTNEELETTKEELQSTNEELTTLNEELHVRNRELQLTNNDLMNLLQSVELPVIMLDADLKIRRFTERSRELFNLIQTDTDRPLLDIQASFDSSGLRADLLRVLRDYQRIERTITAKDGRPWRLAIHPFRTSEKQVEGVVIVATELSGA